MGRIVILRGLPGVGKTTTAALLRDRLVPAARVSVDTIRYLARPRGFDAASIRQSEVASVALGRSFALQGVNVIIEGAILDIGVVETMVGSCHADGLPVTVVNLEASLPHLLARNNARASYDRVPDDRVRALHARFSTSTGLTISSDDRVPEEVVDCILELLPPGTDDPVTGREWCLLFMQHGAADVDDDRYPDHDTMPLSDEGRRQVLATRTALMRLGIERIITSPFRRCAETADVLNTALRVPLEIDGRLRERSFPAFHGRPYDEIASEIGADAADRLRYDSSTVSMPGVEDLPTMRARVLDAVRDIQNRPDQRTLVVSHGGPHGWLCAHALGQNDERIARRFPLGHARMSAFGARPDMAGLRLLSLNTNAEALLTPGLT